MKFRHTFVAIIGILLGAFSAIPSYIIALNGNSDFNSTMSVFTIHQLEPFLFLTDLLAIIIAVSIIVVINRSLKINAKKSLKEFENDNLREELEKVRGNLYEAIDEKKQIKDDFRKTTAKLRIRMEKLVASDLEKKPIVLYDIIDLDVLREIQNSVSFSLNVYSAVFDSTGEMITRPSGGQKACQIVQDTTTGKKECYWFQRNIVEKAFRHGKPVFKQCPLSGLVCGGVPIVIDDRHLATWMIGQAKVMPIDEEELARTAAKFDFRSREILESHKSIPKVAVVHFEAMLNMLWGFSKELSALAYGNIRLSQNSYKLKKAENESKMLWAALNLSNDAIIIYNHDKKIISANEVICNRLGYSRAKMHELRISDLVKSDKALRNLSSDGTSFLLKNNDNQMVEFSAVHKMIGNGNKEINCIIARPMTENTPAE